MLQTDHDKAHDIVQKTMNKVAEDFPHWAMPLHTMELVIDENCKSNGHPTMATNGFQMFCHPEYALSQEPIDLNSTVLEELLHKVLLHPLRAKGKDHETFNIAADIAINCMIAEQKKYGYHVSRGVCYDVKYHGWTTEEIYKDIYKKQKEKDKNDQPRFQSRPGAQVMPAPEGQEEKLEQQIVLNDMINKADATRKEKRRLEQEEKRTGKTINKLNEKAHKAGKLAGSLSTNIQPKASRVDAGQIIAKIVDSKLAYRRDWARPNKRVPFYSPSKRVNSVSKLVLLIDTSGSVSQSMVETFAGFARDVASSHRIDEIVIIQTDTRLQKVDTFLMGDEVEITRHGGGGTHFADAMHYVAENHADATLGCFLTDMKVSNYGEEPPFDMTWLNYGPRGRQAPYGETIDCLI